MPRTLAFFGPTMLILAAVSGCRPKGYNSQVASISAGDATSCSIPEWKLGQAYKVGDKVLLKGSAYVATHDNPGLDPTVSTWYWSTSTGCSSGDKSITIAPPASPEAPAAPQAAPAPQAPPTTASNAGNAGNAGGCSAPAWHQFQNYKTGDKVQFKDAVYVATHDNPGEDPTVSTWYWSPSSGCDSGGGGGGGGGDKAATIASAPAQAASGGSCTPWHQFQNYKAGDKVLFKGAAYVATHDNPGEDPTVSTWYWSPSSGCDHGTADGAAPPSQSPPSP